MYVCQCSAVTQREVAAAIDAGADTLSAVEHETHAGIGCGGCHESIEAMIAERCGHCPRLSLVVS
jgi:NAD(P)H-nitrite reductase large subunit